MTASTQLQTLTHKRSITMTVGLALGAGIATLAFTLTPGAQQQASVPAAQPVAAFTGAALSLGTEYPDEAPNAVGWVPQTGAIVSETSRPAVNEYEDDAPNVVGWVPSTGAYAVVAARASVSDYEEAAPAVTGWEARHATGASAPATGQYEDDAPNVTPWAPSYSASYAEPRRYGATVVEARRIGQDWVGPEAQEMGAGFETSADGLRQYRAPRYNPFTGFIQADLLSRDAIEDEWVGHSHIEITGVYFDGE